MSHVTRAPLSFKVKRSNVKLQGRGILWRPPAQLVQSYNDDRGVYRRWQKGRRHDVSDPSSVLSLSLLPSLSSFLSISLSFSLSLFLPPSPCHYLPLFSLSLSRSCCGYIEIQSSPFFYVLAASSSGSFFVSCI